FMVMTYDNDGWGISRMHLVAAHETGHIFGALDEYASSGCRVTDSWGYLNAPNTSCNNGGTTTDQSIMGDSNEQVSPSVDVSTSARAAVGWRNPTVIGSQTVVDVQRTSGVSINPPAQNPSGSTPQLTGAATNQPYPPGGCNIYGGACSRVPAAVSITRVSSVDWSVDSGGWTAGGVTPL